MKKYLLISDTDESDDDNNSEDLHIEIKTYTPKELNSVLLNKMNHLAGNFEDINMIGDIVECRNYKSLIAFKLKNNGESFDCIGRSWVINPEKVMHLENMNCKISGNIIANIFHGPRFQFNVIDIELETDDTKLKRLKEQCKEKGYFVNKKNIPWDNIKNIGIISKTNTQGYNDFMKQFKIPVIIHTEEITLEGENTSNQCIQSIRKLQNVDIIIIIRGGGDTSEISNSFDTVELFDAIHKSNVPIITAIGHEADKGDKLLITEVSDFNYPTPSSASNGITKILLKPILEKIDFLLCEIKSLITEKLNSEYDKLYNVLECLFAQHKKEKFGGEIIKIGDDIDFILLENGGNIYKNKINFNEKMNFNINEVNRYEEISEGIKNRDIETIKNLFNDNIEGNTLNENINNNINEITKIKKMEEKFKNIKQKKINTLYCKNHELTSLKINKLISLNSMFLWYKTSLTDFNEDLKEIYNYGILLE